MTTETQTEIKVWIGSLAAYNAGALVGEWFEIEEDQEAADFWNNVKTRISAIGFRGMSDHELLDELDVMDTDGLPDYLDLFQWDRVQEFIKLDDHDRAIASALIDAGLTSKDESLKDLISDHYHGCHESKRAYAIEYVHECYDFDAVPDIFRDCFDYDAFANYLFTELGSAFCAHCKDQIIYG
jgi:antirestriction protein